MKERLGIVVVDKMLSYFSIFWLLMSSTTVAFAVRNMFLTMMILLGTAFIVLLRNKVISRINLRILLVGMLLIIGNCLTNLQYYTLSNDVVIVIINLLSCAIISSSMHYESVMKNYVHIMKWMAIVSLICFIYTAILKIGPLPFQKAEIIGENYYEYSFYYVVYGCGGPNRNSGMFWEPGGYQIYLNIALLFVICRPDLFSKTKNNAFKLIILFTITVFSTLSTTAYLCLGVVLTIGILNNGLDKSLRRQLLSAVLFAAIALIIVEFKLGIVESKLINRGGSFYTRSNDIIVSSLYAFTRPVFGYGLSNSHIIEALAEHNVVSNSNGLGSFMCRMGIPLAVGYVIWMTFRFKQMLKTNKICSILVGALLLLFFLTESVLLVTMFIFFLFVPQRELNVEEKEACKTEC